MALIQQVRGVRIAEVELVIEINPSRHDVLGECVGDLERQAVVESSLPLQKERIVVVETWANERVELSRVSRTVAALSQKVRIQIRQYDGGAGASARVRSARRTRNICRSARRRVKVQIVCAGGGQVDSVTPGGAEGVPGNVPLPDSRIT
jgi:hypothetical protein